jgi:hypothetical protein
MLSAAAHELVEKHQEMAAEFLLKMKGHYHIYVESLLRDDAFKQSRSMEIPNVAEVYRHASVSPETKLLTRHKLDHYIQEALHQVQEFMQKEYERLYLRQYIGAVGVIEAN